MAEIGVILELESSYNAAQDVIRSLDTDEMDITRVSDYQEGIAAAKARGVKFGRPPLPLPENFHDAHRDWRSKKVTLRQER